MPGGEIAELNATPGRREGGMGMKKVQRTKGIRKVIRVNVLGGSVQKYVTAGDRACGRMVRGSRRQRQHIVFGPSDSAILAWAQFDLSREILGGFWNVRTA